MSRARSLPRALIVEGADELARWGALRCVPSAQRSWLDDSNLPEADKRLEERVFSRRAFDL